MPPVNPGTTDLVWWYAFDEQSGTRYDAHGDYDMTDYNTVGYESGVQGNAADFNSSNAEYLKRAHASGLEVAGSMTICGWITLDATGSYRVVFIKGTVNDRAFQILVHDPTNTLKWYIRNSANTAWWSVVSGQAVTGGGFYFFAAVYDDDNDLIRIRIDDNSWVTTNNVTSHRTESTLDWTIGGKSDGTVTHEGNLDEMCRYDRMLTETETASPH